MTDSPNTLADHVEAGEAADAEVARIRRKLDWQRTTDEQLLLATQGCVQRVVAETVDSFRAKGLVRTVQKTEQ